MSERFSVAMKRIPHYWKWQAWTQPVFSDSNIASDGSVISSDSIRPDSNDYGAMDGIKSGSGERHTWKSDSTHNCYWKVVFPYEIKITGLTHYNARNRDNLYRNVQGRFYADEAMSTPIGDAISTPVTSWYQTPIANIPSEGIITDTIYFRKTGGDLVSGIGELEITAQVAIEVGSSEDYDFITYTYDSFIAISPYIPIPVAESIANYTNAGNFSYTVPANVTKIKVEVAGAGGGRSGYGSDEDGHSSARMSGGRGGITTAFLPVVPGTVIPLSVGLAGTNGADDTSGAHFHHAGNGVNGGNSTFDAITALGGEGGIAGYFLQSANHESYVSSKGRVGTSYGNGGIGASYSKTTGPLGVVTDTPAQNGWVKITSGGDLQKTNPITYILVNEVTE